MYSGYLAAEPEEQNDNMFYWLFKNQDTFKPLILWLGGKYDQSSLYGIFKQNGPLRVQQNDSTFKILRNDESWLEEGSLLYVDYLSD
jgi:carboxypeptidase C (cathepsin A)